MCGVEVASQGKSQSPPVSAIPSTMLTPLSSLTSASIDMSGSSVSLTPVPSPPTSGLSTPTSDHMLVKARRDSYDRSSSKSRSRCGSQSSLNENPLPVQSARTSVGNIQGGVVGGASSSSLPSTKSSTPVGILGGVPLAGGGIMPTVGSLSLSQHARLSVASPSGRSSHLQGHHSHSPGGSHLSQATGPGSLVGSMILHQQQQQHHLTAAAVRPLNQPTVVASPLKIPVSQLPHSVQHNLTSWGATGTSKESGKSGEGKGPSKGAEVKGGIGGPRAGGQVGGGQVGGGQVGAAVLESADDVKKDSGGVASASSEGSPQKRTRLSRKAAASAQPGDMSL